MRRLQVLPKTINRKTNYNTNCPNRVLHSLAMPDHAAKTISRHDYQPYPYRVEHASLHFDLDADETRVRSTLRVRGAAGTALVLDGQDLTLESISIDGRPLAPNQYQIDNEHLDRKSTRLNSSHSCATRI